MLVKKDVKKLQNQLQNQIKTSAPGKVILFGEHAVVYDKLGVATTVDRRCSIKVTSNNENTVFIESRNLNLVETLKESTLFKLFNDIEKLKNENNFDKIKEIGEKDKLAASFFVIANLMIEYGFKPLKIFINSEIPKNIGSSSSVFSAVTLAVSKFLDENLSKKKISDFAYEGDVIAHGGTPSGIDNSIVTYGGYIQYKKSEGIKPLKINFELPLIFVDSGEPVKTGDTVPYVRKQREKNEKFVDKVLEKLNNISIQSLDVLKKQNLELVGKLMLKYYLELKKLKISTEKLDKIIEIGVKHNALGAKPTGGWGGGCCIVLVETQKQANNLMKIYKENGFNSFQAKIGVDGVKEV